MKSISSVGEMVIQLPEATHLWLVDLLEDLFEYGVSPEDVAWRTPCREVLDQLKPGEGRKLHLTPALHKWLLDLLLDVDDEDGRTSHSRHCKKLRELLTT